MYNLKLYQIYHDLIAYFATLIKLSKKSQLGLIFRTGGSITKVEPLPFLNKTS